MSTRFSCGQHFVPSATMAHAFAVYDTDGNLADCLITGDAVEDVVAGTHPRANEPSFDLGTCRVGEVTSGTMGPSVKKAIGIGYVPTALAAEGSTFHIDIRGRGVAARVVKTPFLKKG